MARPSLSPRPAWPAPRPPRLAAGALLAVSAVAAVAGAGLALSGAGDGPATGVGADPAAWAGAGAVLASPERFREWVQGLGPWAPLAFFLVEALQVIVAPLPGSIFPPVGALAFGPWPALALTVGGTAAGSVVVFALARRWGRPLVRRLVGRETLERYTGVAAAGGGVWLGLVFVVPLLPGDAVCALAGLSPVSCRRFLLLSTLGRLPGTVLSVFLVAELAAGPAWLWPVAALAAGAGLLLALTFRRRLEARLLRRAGGRRPVPWSGRPVLAAPVVLAAPPAGASGGSAERPADLGQSDPPHGGVAQVEPGVPPRDPAPRRRAEAGGSGSRTPTPWPPDACPPKGGPVLPPVLRAVALHASRLAARVVCPPGGRPPQRPRAAAWPAVATAATLVPPVALPAAPAGAAPAALPAEAVTFRSGNVTLRGTVVAPAATPPAAPPAARRPGRRTRRPCSPPPPPPRPLERRGKELLP